MLKTGFCSFAAPFHANSNDWAKKAMLLPDLEQRVKAMIGFIFSNQQAQCRRSPAIRQPCCCRRSCIVIQLSEYLLNNYRVFNAGNYLDETCAIATFLRLLEGPLLAGSRHSNQPIDLDLSDRYPPDSGHSSNINFNNKKGHNVSKANGLAAFFCRWKSECKRPAKGRAGL